MASPRPIDERSAIARPIPCARAGDDGIRSFQIVALACVSSLPRWSTSADAVRFGDVFVGHARTRSPRSRRKSFASLPVLQSVLRWERLLPRGGGGGGTGRDLPAALMIVFPRCRPLRQRPLARDITAQAAAADPPRVILGDRWQEIRVIDAARATHRDRVLRLDARRRRCRAARVIVVCRNASFVACRRRVASPALVARRAGSSVPSEEPVGVISQPPSASATEMLPVEPCVSPRLNSDAPVATICSRRRASALTTVSPTP